MNTVDVLLPGHLERNDDGSLDNTYSTVTLIRTGDGRRIIVDTSSPWMYPELMAAFRKKRDIYPNDVDTVVLTHNHTDHTGNVEMFPNAKVLIHEGEIVFPGAEIIYEDQEIAPGVLLVHTPGHTRGSMSVFVQTDRRVAIAGDAVPLSDNLLKEIPPRQNTDPAAALSSIRAIAAWADVVIPGHGVPFPLPGRRLRLH
ncbi:MAG: MBL fold metallo-hydrolase [Candidatus Methanomethylophilus sp.]|jgi:N-acyl homoserine lactone hydrolase|nr:MBL fold metallo-hydrolase [Methanomethylophilus sp.]MDD3233603.1 MBL fold metallo-hydrolase [Methanomethylophilus sp.]MDD4221986.1 MBL fold metallo-hydrolase [Methanomethylophilus sp.]MDD4668220.1 MBL fold metallo-hydrolase [Methanomethylophilus sp.]